MIDVATSTLYYLSQSQQFLSSKVPIANQKSNINNNSINSFDNNTVASPELMEMQLSSSIELEENFIRKQVKQQVKDEKAKAKENQISKSKLVTKLKNSKKLQPSQVSTEINIPTTSTSINSDIYNNSKTALSQFTTFPVGVLNGKRNLKKSMLVRGREDGSQVIEFEKWLLPYNQVLNILGFNAQNLPDGRVELRGSPTVTTRINLNELTSDPKLGLVFSIQDLEKYFGVGAQFDMREYAIRLDIPQLNRRFFDKIDRTPVNLEGLPSLQAPEFSLSSVSQRLTVQGGENQSTNWQGDVSAIGTAFGGSWFLRTQRLQFQDKQRWNLAEAQFLRQTEAADYIVGSQSPFWSNMGNTGSYWGFTTIQRHGFAPSESAFNTSPLQRLRATPLGRNCDGRG